MPNSKLDFDCTIIVPFLKSSPERARNLLFVLNRLPKELPIIIAAQHLEWDEPIPELPLLGRRPAIMEIDPSGKPIEKARMLNKAIAAAKTEYVWVVDADIILPFHQILAIASERAPFFAAMKPYDYLLKLNEEESSLFMQKGVIQNSAERRAYVMVLGAASFIIRKNVYQAMGGMDERYTGWGFEDHDFNERYRGAGHEFLELKSPAIHLWHPRLKLNRKNLRLFKSKGFSLTSRLQTRQ